MYDPQPEGPSEVMSDVLYYLSKANAAGVNLVSHFDRSHGIVVDQMGAILNEGLTARNAKSSELKKLQERFIRCNDDYLKVACLVKKLTAEVTENGNQLKALTERKSTRERDLESLRKQLEEMNIKVNESAAEHVRAAAAQNQELGSTKAALEQSRTRIVELEAELLKTNTFMEETVPTMCTEAHTACLGAILRKIRFKFFEADMSYFSNLRKIPEGIQLDPAWLVIPSPKTDISAVDDGENEDDENDDFEKAAYLEVVVPEERLTADVSDSRGGGADIGAFVPIELD